MKLVTLSLIYAVLATATPFAAGEEDEAAIEDHRKVDGETSGSPYGVHAAEVILNVDCTTDEQCAGVPDKGKGACQDKEAYKAMAPKDANKDDVESISCAWSKVLAGKCGTKKIKGKCACYAPDDKACTYIITCRKFSPFIHCGAGKERPNSYRNLDDATTMCSCPRVCSKARAGFQVGDKPQDECSPKGNATPIE
ncbi:uncharacterized protein J3D65DRAFT_661641 [Phyllosticta citribraziliensis]|uniref:Uncharacterized protein n=1 Tax=Phyllosticta citribraziliensis TaxID=989973 RepID=A0ABR1LFJ1_9PEZI